MKASDLRRPSSLRCRVNVRYGACAAQSAIEGMTSDRMPASTRARTSTAIAADTVGGRRNRSKLLATGVRISASTIAPAVGMRKSRAT